MTIVVKFGGDPIAKSPFTVGVAAPLDLSKVTVDNMDGSKLTSSSVNFLNGLEKFSGKENTSYILKINTRFCFSDMSSKA